MSLIHNERVKLIANALADPPASPVYRTEAVVAKQRSASDTCSRV